MWLHPPCKSEQQGSLKRSRTTSGELLAKPVSSQPDAARSSPTDEFDVSSEEQDARGLARKRVTSEKQLDTLEWSALAEAAPEPPRQQQLGNCSDTAPCYSGDAGLLGLACEPHTRPAGHPAPQRTASAGLPLHTMHATHQPLQTSPAPLPVSVPAEHASRQQQQQHLGFGAHIGTATNAGPSQHQQGTGASLPFTGSSRAQAGPSSPSPGRQHCNRSSSSGEPGVSGSGGSGGAGGAPGIGASSLPAANECPPHGVKAIMGRRSKMEDAFKTVPFLLEVPVADRGTAQAKAPRRVAEQLQQAPAAAAAAAGPSPVTIEASTDMQQSSQSTGSQDSGRSSYIETFHFFGVFDGHGGDAAALYCSSTLHQHIADALSGTPSPSASDAAFAQAEPPSDYTADGQANTVSSVTLNGAPVTGGEALSSHSSSSGDERFVDADQSEAVREAAAAVAAASGGGDEARAVFSAHMIETAISEAFCRTDNEFGESENAALVGTTAVVALVGTRVLYIANCGDSRAVLCRSGVAYPLTDDHKAAREDETARIEAAGGQILFWNGVRVMGVLAVSRAIGDHCLRPFVVAEPEVTILKRHQDDELLLLASDGLWDVLSNQEAASLAMRCVQRARARGATREGAARIAATVLTRAAVDRGSRDNVTVVVIDLSAPDAGGETASGSVLSSEPAVVTADNSAAAAAPVAAEARQDAAPAVAALVMPTMDS